MSYDIAIIGMAGRFPGASSVDELWEKVVRKQELTSRFDQAKLADAGIPADQYTHPEYVPVRGVLADADRFDADFFQYSAREAAIIDPQQRVLLECAWHALESAGRGTDQDRVGVFAGTGSNTYLLRQVLRQPNLDDLLGSLPIIIGSEKDHAATRVAHKLGLTGPAITVQTSCSTSLVAVHLACQSLFTGDSDLALAGGVSIELPQSSGHLYEPNGIGSPDGHCRAFDAQAAGTVAGNGAGLVVLRRAKDAIADRDPILAVIQGSAVNNDGAAKVGYTAPSVSGQAAVIRAALAAAQVDTDAIGYVATHGTGTEIGDQVEIAALTEAFRGTASRTGYCAVSSLKPNIGHLDAAAGVAGLILAVQALRHRVLPPSTNFETPNPAIDWDSSPFYVNTAARPWAPPAAGTARLCGVSSFGIGGTNAHVVLAEADPAFQPPAAPPEPEVVVLVRSAATSEALTTVDQLLSEHLDRAECSVSDAAHTLQVGRRALKWRAATAWSGDGSLRAALAASPVCEVTGPAHLVFVLPGEGSQFPGMAAGLYEQFPVFRDALAEACAALRSVTGQDLRPLLCEPGDEDRRTAELREPQLMQAAIFAMQSAVLELLNAAGIRPSALVGHGLGELAAARAAGGVSLPEAARLLEGRSAALAEAAPGRMLAAHGPDGQVRACAAGRVQVAAIDTPEDLVLAGSPEAITEVAQDCQGLGLAVRAANVSRAMYIPAMRAASARMHRSASEIQARPLTATVASTMTGQSIPLGASFGPDHWADQLMQPVLFWSALSEAINGHDPLVVDLGPGQQLAPLIRQQLGAGSRTTVLAAQPGSSATAAQRGLLEVASAAWTRGVDVDWAALTGSRRRRVSLPLYPFARDRHWIGGTATPSAPSPTAATGGGEGCPGTGTCRQEQAVGSAVDVEAILAQLWEQLLGTVEPDPGMDFFAVGGTSLYAVRILVALRKRFRVRLTLEELVGARTLRDQAELVKWKLTDG